LGGKKKGLKKIIDLGNFGAKNPTIQTTLEKETGLKSFWGGLQASGFRKTGKWGGNN